MAPRIPQIRLYQDWLAKERGLRFDSYDALWNWSVGDLEAFWRSIWDYHGIATNAPFERALSSEAMPGAVWFKGAEINYAREVLRHADAADAKGLPAIVAEDEQGETRILSWKELRAQVASLALTLQQRGVSAGDRVAGYLPNIPEAVVGMLACASLGAIWSLCAPDMGVPAVLDRFRQISPKVLIGVDGVFYAGKSLDRGATLRALREALPSVETLMVLHSEHGVVDVEADVDLKAALSQRNAEVDAFEPKWVPFEQPLWILYSSGTTGLPKALVHSHGGALMIALAAGKHLDHGPSYDANTFGERFFWYTSTGWVMWNAQVAALLRGTTICLFDGSPSGAKDNPDWGVLWRFASKHKVTSFGAGAAFYANCVKADLNLAQCGDLSSIAALGATGSPLPIDVQNWFSEAFARLGTPDIWWCNISGGTDICGAFVTGNRELPPAPGKMQCRQLGSAVAAWDEAGREVIGEVGELVCTRPLPSMPVFLWGDIDGSRYRESYFDVYPGVWRHGDWLKIDADGSCSISGRSDATINRGGLRMGTSEIYSAVERLSEVADAMVIDLPDGQGDTKLVLFVALREGLVLDDALRAKISAAIRQSLSPRFVPDLMLEAPGVPRTLTGKKQELPIKKMFAGHAIEKVISRDVMANPEVLAWYVDLANRKPWLASGGG